MLLSVRTRWPRYRFVTLGGALLLASCGSSSGAAEQGCPAYGQVSGGGLTRGGKHAVPPRSLIRELRRSRTVRDAVPPQLQARFEAFPSHVRPRFKEGRSVLFRVDGRGRRMWIVPYGKTGLCFGFVERILPATCSPGLVGNRGTWVAAIYECPGAQALFVLIASDAVASIQIRSAGRSYRWPVRNNVAAGRFRATAATSSGVIPVTITLHNGRTIRL